MKRKTKTLRILVLILLFSMIFPVTANAATPDVAEPCTNNYVRNVYAWISNNGGTVTISFSITGSGIMTEIGASCIRLYNASGTLVKTFWPSSYSDMLTSNRASYTSSVTYSGSSSTSYYAVVTGYAANSSGSGTQKYTTETT